MKVNSKNLDVLVIGSGFLGRRLAEYLRIRGLNVGVASRSSPSTTLNSFKLDLLDSHSIGNTLRSSTPDCIILTAFNFSLDSEVNLKMVRNLLVQLSVENQKPKFIYYSTSAEYGSLESPRSNFSEDSPQNPVNKYGEIKALITNELAAELERHNILRIFNPYSTEMPEKYFLGKIWREIRQIQKAKSGLVRSIDLSYHSDVRDFIDLQSLFDVTENIVNRNDDIGILNVASGTGTKISDLTEMLITKYCEGRLSLKLDESKPFSSLPYSIGDVSKLISLGIIPKQMEVFINE